MLSLLYGPTLTSVHDYWKKHTLTIWTLDSKVMSLFNMLCRFVIIFLPKSKFLFISWLQSLSVFILEPKKIKSVSVSTFFPSICHEVMGLEAVVLVYPVFSFYLLRVRAKLLQLCPTLCDPMDCSPPGFPVHGILQA